MIPIAPQTVKLGGLIIYGQIMPVQIPKRTLKVIRTPFWGVLGESEIQGGLAGRAIDVPVLLHGFTANQPWASAKDLQNYISVTLNQNFMGQNGDLTIGGNGGHPVYHDCTFEGCDQNGGVIKDVVGMLGGYICPVVLHFYQLR